GKDRHLFVSAARDDDRLLRALGIFQETRQVLAPRRRSARERPAARLRERGTPRYAGPPATIDLVAPSWSERYETELVVRSRPPLRGRHIPVRDAVRRPAPRAVERRRRALPGDRRPGGRSERRAQHRAWRGPSLGWRAGRHDRLGNSLLRCVGFVPAPGGGPRERARRVPEAQAVPPPRRHA